MRRSPLYFGGETIPTYFPNYGPGIMASFFGCKPRFKPESATVWFDHPVPLDKIVDYLSQFEFSMKNPWLQRFCKITESSAQHGRGVFHTAITDLGGILDILSSFLSPKQLIMAYIRQPAIVDKCREIILDRMMKVYDKLQGIVEQYQSGCNTWLNLWCPKRWYPIQADFCAMLSPKLFQRFVLPDIITQAEHMDFALYHLDGPN